MACSHGTNMGIDWVQYQYVLWIGCGMNKVRLCLCVPCGDSVMWL